MIINLLLNLVILVFGFLFSILPVVTLADIPYAGQFISDLLIIMIHVWNAFLETFPYAQDAWYLFLLVVLPFEILMLVAKFFLGSRAPGGHI